MQTDTYNRHKWDRLLKDLGSKDDEVRYRAYAEAQSLTDDQLLELANAEIKQYRRYMKRTRVGGWVSLISIPVMMVVSFVLTICSIGPGYLASLVFAFSFVWFLALIGFGCCEWPRQFVRSRRMMSLLFRNRKDARFAGAALLMWNSLDAEIAHTISTALQQLLPNLRAGDAQGWTKEQKTALLAPLQRWYKPLQYSYKDIDLTLCVLKALEQVGDVSAIEPVQKLADMAVSGHEKEKIKEVKQAAAECLESLLARIAPEGQKQTLLRAVETVATPETLLRPANTGATEIPAEQLLRPKE